MNKTREIGHKLKKYIPKKIYTMILWILFDRDIKQLCRHRKMVKKADEINEKNCKRIAEKKKIRIAFLFGSSSYWTGDTLFELFRADKRFEPYVIVVPFFNGTDASVYHEYKRTVKFFYEKNIKVIGTAKDKSMKKNKNYKECGSPDIVFVANPYVTNYPKEWKPSHLPISVLSFYIPYGFLLADIPNSQFNNKESHHLFWKIFCETEITKKMFKKYSEIGDRNVVFSGYPKMDIFYDDKEVDNDTDVKKDIWKGKKDAKRIIFSPHHSIKMEDSGLQHSTFLDNYKFILEMAKKYSDTTSWIFRPHPLLEKACYYAGVFKSPEEWNAFLNEWRTLDNCVVQISGDYSEAFKTCDAIINDSVSYMAEILYVHKPMLYLKSNKATFNDLGRSLEKVHYSCSGDDLEKIEEFIKMVLDERDPMFEKREEYFSKYMDYKSTNGIVASQYIYDYINKALAKQKGDIDEFL